MNRGNLMNLSAMAIFGTIGIFVRHISLPSALIALVRAAVGLVFLLAVLLLQRRRPDTDAIQKNLLPLLLGGVMLGGNWIALFEAYRHTTIAQATMGYYMAPLIVMLLSPIVLKERLTAWHFFCLCAAAFGMSLVAGPSGSGTSGLGLGFALLAAALYAGVILSNRKLSGLSAYDTTLVQLGVSAAVLAPYVLLSVDISALSPAPLELGLLAVVGVIHTGLAYTLYFGSIPMLPARTVAVYGYLDPILALILSALVLGEPLGLPGMAGAALVLVSTALINRKGGAA